MPHQLLPRTDKKLRLGGTVLEENGRIHHRSIRYFTDVELCGTGGVRNVGICPETHLLTGFYHLADPTGRLWKDNFPFICIHRFDIVWLAVPARIWNGPEPGRHDDPCPCPSLHQCYCISHRRIIIIEYAYPSGSCIASRVFLKRCNKQRIINDGRCNPWV